MLKVLDKEPTLLNQFLAEIRDVEIQKDSMRFRRNLERIGEIMAYEISKTLHYQTQTIETPLGESEIPLSTDRIVLAPILRAGLPFHQGFLNYFDKAENAFIAAYRHYHKDNQFTIELEHVSGPSLEGKILIIIDPMLATGASSVKTYEALVEHGGKPAFTHIAGVVASRIGIDHIVKNIPTQDATIWTASLDNELTVKSYIVPGLGDAGDLAFGEKL